MSFQRRLARCASLALFCSATARAAAPVDDPPPRALTLAAVEREVVARSRELGAARMRADAMSAESAAEGRLPDPEVMGQLWQVPLASPASLGDAQMVMAGVSQAFPAPGSLGGRERAAEARARAERAEVDARTRELVRDVDHAFVDYAEASERARAKRDQLGALASALANARVRVGAGGSVAELAAAEVELARAHAEIAAGDAAIDVARAALAALLGREGGEPLGAPELGPAEGVAADAPALASRALERRPELRAAHERGESAREGAASAAAEARLPSFSVAALYFAPVGPMPHHAYGANVSVALPWVWGGARERAKAADARASAELADVEASRRRVAADVTRACSRAAAAEQRLRALVAEVVPAAERARRAADATLGGARGDVAASIGATKARAEAAIDVAEARAALAHALVDLDWAAGERVPRRALETNEEVSHVR